MTFNSIFFNYNHGALCLFFSVMAQDFLASFYGKEKNLIIIGDIDRISMYGKQSSCMEEKKYAGLCFCKTQFTRTAKPIY